MAARRRHGRNFLRSVPVALAQIFALGLSLALLAVLGPRPAAAAVPPFSSILVVASTGRVLEAQDADALRHPASLTKLMTLYLTFEALRDRRITLDQLVPVSAHAASMQPTKLGLVPGMRITVRQAILGLITRSANDAAVALGELLGGSETRFAQMMTLRARALGMRHTVFVNASGLPAADQWTTARDMATLARRLIADFPEDYSYFSTPSFVFHGQTVVNLDRMLKLYPGVDGLKTGFVDASGHNLVTSAVNHGVRLIGVEFGAPSWPSCYGTMAQMMNAGYAELAVPLGGKTVLAEREAPHRLPSLIASAHAETVPHRLPVPPRRRPIARALARPQVQRVSSLRLLPQNWGIQVGAFRSPAVARSAALRARRIADGGPIRVERIAVRRGAVWRAQVTGLTEHQAYDACGRLSHGHGGGCIVLRLPAPRRIARS